MKVLVADDDALIRELLSNVLREQGLTVITASDGEEALEAIDAQLPDLLLLDLNMPRMDGFTLLDVLRTEPGYPLRRGFEFPAPEGDHSAKRYLYNAVVDAADPRGSQVVFVCDRPADTDELYGSGGLADVLARAGHNVIVAVVDTPSQQTLRAAREAL